MSKKNSVDVMEGQAAFIRWHDSSVRSGWYYDDEPPAVKEIESIGYVCGLSAQAIRITCARSGTGGVASPLTIPLSCIVEYLPIELPQKQSESNAAQIRS